MLKNNRDICSILVVISISFLSYFNTFANSFHFDDFRYIINNEAFKEYIDHTFSVRETFSNLSNRSIVLATLYLNYSIDGFNVLGFHVVNLMIHILTCFLIFLFVKETLSINQLSNIRQIPPSPLCKRVDRGNYKINIPLIAALIFAVHPINTQAVTYITGRSSLLAACFYIASFLFFIKGIRQRESYNALSINLPFITFYSKKLIFLILSVVFLIVGYGSKMIIMTAPLMFIIYCLIFTRQNSFFQRSIFFKRFFDKRFVKFTIQTVILSSPLILIFLSKFLNPQKISSADSGIFSKLFQPIQSKLMFITALTEDIISSSIYLLTEFKVIVFYYLKMIFFPFNQNIDPDFPVARGIIDPGVLLSLSIIILCLYAGIYFYKKNRLVAFGIFWFFVTLLPTSSMLPLLDTVTEHRLYLPLLGIVLIISAFINYLIYHCRRNSLKQITNIVIFVFFPIIVLSMLTAKRNFAWKDEKSLWLDATQKSPRLARPFNNLGEAYDKENDYKKAIDAQKKSISLSPKNYKSYNNLGKIYGKLGQLNLAMENLKLALKNKPNYPIGHYNLGKVYELKGMLDSAIEEYSTAFKQQYDFFEACFNLANVYDKKGQYQEAIDTYINCLKFKSTYPETYFALGNIFGKTGKWEKAFEYYSRAVELDRNYFLAKIAMANIFVMKGNFDKAVKMYLQVIESDPNSFNAHSNLGFLYLQQLNQPSQAVYHFKKSLEINPNQQIANLLRELIKRIPNN